MNLKSNVIVNKHLLFLVVSLLLVFSCSDDEGDKIVTQSDDVPELTSFGFLANGNVALYQDIVFQKLPDNSFGANVVHEIDLGSIKPTFNYPGKTSMNGKDIFSGETTLNFGDEFVVQFDGRNVIFRIHRYYAIPVMYISTENAVGVKSKEEYVNCSIRIDGKIPSKISRQEIARQQE